ncbi:MAG TPA: hypothetical protein VGO43_01295, partial [Pyrinomonadaceae bacterium]|nr:hypothetical protein [Pyrinomonadaceae bacterium]
TIDDLFLEPKLGSDPVASVLDPNGTYQFVGGNAGKKGYFTKPDRNNFGPVVSFAWVPGGMGMLNRLFGEKKTVIRGGVRIGYVNDEYIKSAVNAGVGNAGLSATANALSPLTGASGFLNDRASGSLTPPTALAYIKPPFTYATNNARATNFGTVFAIDPNLQVERETEINIGLQRELGWDTVFEIRYVGTRSNSLVRTIDYNQVDIRNNGFGADYIRALGNARLCDAANAATPGSCLTGSKFNGAIAGSQVLTVIPNLLPAGQALFTSANLALGTPADLAITLVQGANTGTVKFLANPNTGVANVLANGGKLRYNALQTEIRRRFTNGWALNANYTFQKILTNITDDGINQNRVNPYLDNANPKLDYSRAAYDTTHSFNLSSIYELPFGKGRHFLNQGGITNQIFGGWQIGNIVQITSGAPITFLDARGTLNRAARANNQTASTNLTKDQIRALLGFRNVNGTLYFIDPSIIGTSGRAANGFGTTPFAGQVFFNVNPGQTGNLERYAFNGPMYWNWDANIIKNFGISESTRLQLRLEAFNVTNSARFGAPSFAVGSTSFGKITSAYGPRIMQIAARFEF